MLRLESSDTFSLQVKEIPWEPTYPFSKRCSTREPNPGSIGSSGVPLSENVPFESVVPFATRCSDIAALPGTFPVSFDLTRYM